MRTVAFTGYRPEKMPFTESCEDLGYRRFIASLEALICTLCEQGETQFISGVARGFDLWAAEVVLRMRGEYPGIALVCAVPFPGQARSWSDEDQARYVAVLDAADEVLVLAEYYHRGVYHVRDRAMVDRAELVVCAYDGRPGGTAYTVGYAQRMGRDLIFIDPKTGEVCRQNSSDTD